MPALVLGYETTSVSPQRWTGGAPLPPWLMLVHQQAGGYVMSYPTLLGAMFRLEANAERALRDPSSMITAFRAMAEDPRFDVVRAHRPELVELCATHGWDYSVAQLRTLTRTLGEHFDLPPCEQGIEACVRLERASILPVLGWHWVEATPGTNAIEEGHPDTPVDAQWRDGGRFGEEDLRALTELGAMRSAAEPPALYLIWENSD